MSEREGPTRVTRLVLRDGAEERLLQTCELAILDGALAGRRLRVATPTYRMGSHASNDLVLDEPTVSRHHLELTVIGDGYRLVDLSSSNGTWIGALRVRDVVVREPVVVTLGEVRVGLTPRPDDEEPVPASPRNELGTLVGRSAAMRELFDRLETLAPTETSILLEGETGVGKGEVAETIHATSPRARGPLVVVDCAALAGPLLESELFGHVKGAFTGATESRRGLLEEARGGTVFFDEVGDLPLALQAKLLGAIERRRVTPVGATRPVELDVRVVAATHHDLARAVNEKRFRADLFYRLAVVRLTVPPLRERLSDIPLLVRQFLAELRTRDGEHIPTELSAVTLAQLAAQPWPGNVRELRNAVERAALGLTPDGGEGVAPGREPLMRARERVTHEFERRYLIDLLDEVEHNVSAAARVAGLERRNFQRLLRQHGIAPRER